MSKKSQLDKAIEELEAKRAEILAKANTEAAAIEVAIRVLKSQQRKPAVRKPRVVEAHTEKAG